MRDWTAIGGKITASIQINKEITMPKHNYPTLSLSSPAVHRSGPDRFSFVPDDIYIMHHTDCVPAAARTLVQGQIIRLAEDDKLYKVAQVVNRGVSVFLRPAEDYHIAAAERKGLLPAAD